MVRPGNVHEMSGLGTPDATQCNVTGDSRFTVVTEGSKLVMRGGKTITATGYDRVDEPKELVALHTYVPLSNVATCLSCRVPLAKKETRPTV